MGDGHPTRAGEPVVRLSGLATKGGSPATWDTTTRSCAATYCHDRGSGSVRAPRWSDGAAARTCNSCHTSPPPPPHSQSTTCGTAGCHDPRAEVHVDGVVDRR
jgi:predicted CxxxxCH...CXXCH cytochrome family protein